MKKTNTARHIDKTLAEAARRVKSAVKELNQEAAKLVARGKHAAAEPMMEAARSMMEFEGKVKGLREEWRDLLRGPGGTAKGREETTPLWEYYQPILQALMGLGGDATRRDLEKAAEPLLLSRIKAGDAATAAGGRARWKVMIRRARRPMVKEGFLEADSGKTWRLTPEGRRAAKGAVEPGVSTG